MLNDLNNPLNSKYSVTLRFITQNYLNISNLKLTWITSLEGMILT
nr:MAG TPA: hypothetical protein [Caudoviricetes sp.]